MVYRPRAIVSRCVLARSPAYPIATMPFKRTFLILLRKPGHFQNANLCRAGCMALRYGCASGQVSAPEREKSGSYSRILPGMNGDREDSFHTNCGSAWIGQFRSSLNIQGRRSSLRSAACRGIALRNQLGCAAAPKGPFLSGRSGTRALACQRSQSGSPYRWAALRSKFRSPMPDPVPAGTGRVISRSDPHGFTFRACSLTATRSYWPREFINPCFMANIRIGQPCRFNSSLSAPGCLTEVIWANSPGPRSVATPSGCGG